jgi:hypothetical protein
MSRGEVVVEHTPRAVSREHWPSLRGVRVAGRPAGKHFRCRRFASVLVVSHGSCAVAAASPEVATLDRNARFGRERPCAATPTCDGEWSASLKGHVKDLEDVFEEYSPSLQRSSALAGIYSAFENDLNRLRCRSSAILSRSKADTRE